MSQCSRHCSLREKLGSCKQLRNTDRMWTWSAEDRLPESLTEHIWYIAYPNPGWLCWIQQEKWPLPKQWQLASQRKWCCTSHASNKRELSALENCLQGNSILIRRRALVILRWGKTGFTAWSPTLKEQLDDTNVQAGLLQQHGSQHMTHMPIKQRMNEYGHPYCRHSVAIKRKKALTWIITWINVENASGRTWGKR